jgi:hypothetical protein
MSDSWLQKYILLAFRIDKVVQAAYGSQFVESYYGSSEWRSQVEVEAKIPPADLVRQAMVLADTLSAQEFASNRAVYLSKHVKAMETLCRKLSGESFTLEQEAKGCLDISPTWTREEQFERAHTLYEKILPGIGSIAERLQAYRATIAYPQEQADKLPRFIDLAFAEARKRTCTFIEFPASETIDIQYFPTWEHDAAAYYQGNYRTHVAMNVAATGNYLSRLFDHKVCHEAYPGHHTEYVLKEQYLYRQQGYTEQSICLTLSPQCVIQEGVAMMAHEMLFAEGEAEKWIVEHIYRSLQKDVDAEILLRLRQASEMLENVWGNAALLLDQGRPEQEVVQYIARYMLYTEDEAARMIAYLQTPMAGLYNLTYVGGQKLMRPWLQGSDRLTVFRRFLTEQITPAQLKESTLPLYP